MLLGAAHTVNKGPFHRLFIATFCSFFCFLLPLLWAEGQPEPALAAEAQALVSPVLELGEE